MIILAGLAVLITAYFVSEIIAEYRRAERWRKISRQRNRP